MSDHRHFLVRGWRLGLKDFDWICGECGAAWNPVGHKKGAWALVKKGRFHAEA